MGFGRLAIMGLTPDGMQPLPAGRTAWSATGSLYGFRFEKAILERAGYKFKSGSDCEILLPLYYEYGLDMFRHLDAEFALILYDSRKGPADRRPGPHRHPAAVLRLFQVQPPDRLCSELQNLVGWCEDIRPFPIGSYYCDGHSSATRTWPTSPRPTPTGWRTCCATSGKS